MENGRGSDPWGSSSSTVGALASHFVPLGLFGFNGYTS